MCDAVAPNEGSKPEKKAKNPESMLGTAVIKLQRNLS